MIIEFVKITGVLHAIENTATMTHEQFFVPIITISIKYERYY